MPKFIVIPRDEPGQFDHLSPADMQAMVQRYHTWTQELAAAGRLTLGHKLRDGEGKVLRGNGGGAPSVTDGPFVETKEVIGGFWMIEADDLDHAVETVSTCPHLEHARGSLEVRQVEGME